MSKEFTRRFTTKYCLLKRIKFDSSEEKTAGSYWKACQECEGSRLQVLGIILTTIAGSRFYSLLETFGNYSKYSWEQKHGGICKNYIQLKTEQRNNERKIFNSQIFSSDLRVVRCAARRSWLCRRRRDPCGRSGGCWRTARTRRPGHCSSSEIVNNYTIQSIVCENSSCHYVILLCHLVIISHVTLASSIFN